MKGNRRAGATSPGRLALAVLLTLVGVIDLGPGPAFGEASIVPVLAEARLIAVNSVTHKAYVAVGNGFTSSTHLVSVIDGSTNSVTANIAQGDASTGPTFVAVNEATNRVYVSHTGAYYATAIDGATNTVLAAVIGAGTLSYPEGIGANPSTNFIYVANTNGASVSVIDGASNTVVQTLPVGGGDSNRYLTVIPETNRVYMTDNVGHQIVVINGRIGSVEASINTTYSLGALAPALITSNPTTNRLYVMSGSSNLLVLDAATGATVATVSLGGSAITGVAVNPTTNRVYVANGTNTLSIINGAANTVAETVSLPSGVSGRNVAVDTTNGRVYVTTTSSSVAVLQDNASPPTATPVPTAIPTATVVAPPSTDGRYRTYLPLAYKNYVPPATLYAKAYLDSAASQSAGSGVYIRLNDKDVGVTDATGAITVTQSPGTYTVQGVIPSLASGSTIASLNSGQLTEANVILDSDAEVIEPSKLQIDELVNGALALDTPSITLHFVKSGTAITVTDLSEVSLSAVDPTFQPQDVTSKFSVSQGAVRATNASQITSILASIRSDARLSVTAMDANGFTYSEGITFAAGLFQIDGQLVAPQSQPSLVVSGLTVQVQFGNGIKKTLTTDSAGKFQVSQVPGGMVTIESTTASGGNIYNGRANIAASANTNVAIRMLGLADILSGVAPWQVTTAVGVQGLNVVEPDPARSQAASNAPTESASSGRTSSTPTASVNVSGGAQDTPISDRATLTVAKGTKKVTLKYTVTTAEYPTYVLKQSRYNDYWSLQVLSNSGADLYSIYRFVNQELFSPPTWDANGSTGEIQVGIDVSSLTANADAQLTLNATSQNTGDSILPTTVSAALGAAAGITIDNIKMDVVSPTRGDSTRYSIPRPGDTNYYQRHFDVSYTMPDGAKITNVKAELLASSGSVLQTVVDSAVGSSKVQQINDTTLRVQVTFGDNASQIGSTPPPTDQIRYRFTLKGTDSNGATLESKPKESATFYALWRMPDGFARYSVREPGLDDWVAQRTYTWLENNRSLITSINDISGEHGRDIGHNTHANGTDIDMFHVYTFPNGGSSGGANYLQFVQNVMTTLGGSTPEARQQALGLVNSWATATRSRFDTLTSDVAVDAVYYAIGRPAGGSGQPRLGQGWAKTLLETGKYTNPDGLSITLPAGAWTSPSSKMHYNAVHNNHVHITLR